MKNLILLLALFLYSEVYANPYIKEINRVTELGYKIPASTNFVEGKRFMYNLITNTVTVSDKTYSISSWEELQSKNKQNDYYFSSAVIPADGYIESQTRHEIAHAIEYQNNLFKDGQWFEILRKIDVKRDITEYAATNPREAFAEAFALYTSPFYGSKIKRLPVNVERYLESVKQR